jgi:hypothetical protein
MPNFIQLAADDFQRADENPLSDSGKWSGDGIHADVQLVSNAAEGTMLGNFNFAYFTGDVWPDDQYAEVTLETPPNPDPYSFYFGPTVRAKLFPIALYEFLLQGDVLGPNAAVAISLRDQSGQTILAETFTNVPAGATLRLAAQGTTLIGYVNGVQVLQISDNTLSSGVPGFCIYPIGEDVSIVQVASFAAGEITGLSSKNVGDQLISDEMETIEPAQADRGHVFDGVVYGGTISGLAADGSGTGHITPTLDLTLRAGQKNGVRAGVADITYVAANGDSVKFAMIRDSAGDMLAKLVTKN